MSISVKDTKYLSTKRKKLDSLGQTNRKDRNYLIRAIDDDIINVDIETRIEILNLIASSYGSDSKEILWECGTGIQIKFEDISTSVLNDILDIIKKNVEKYKLNLDIK